MDSPRRPLEFRGLHDRPAGIGLNHQPSSRRKPVSQKPQPATQTVASPLTSSSSATKFTRGSTLVDEGEGEYDQLDALFAHSPAPLEPQLSRRVEQPLIDTSSDGKDPTDDAGVTAAEALDAVHEADAEIVFAEQPRLRPHPLPNRRTDFETSIGESPHYDPRRSMTISTAHVPPCTDGIESWEEWQRRIRASGSSSEGESLGEEMEVGAATTGLITSLTGHKTLVPKRSNQSLNTRPVNIPSNEEFDVLLASLKQAAEQTGRYGYAGRPHERKAPNSIGCIDSAHHDGRKSRQEHRRLDTKTGARAPQPQDAIRRAPSSRGQRAMHPSSSQPTQHVRLPSSADSVISSSSNRRIGSSHIHTIPPPPIRPARSPDRPMSPIVSRASIDTQKPKRRPSTSSHLSRTGSRRAKASQAGSSDEQPVDWYVKVSAWRGCSLAEEQEWPDDIERPQNTSHVEKYRSQDEITAGNARGLYEPPSLPVEPDRHRVDSHNYVAPSQGFPNHSETDPEYMRLDRPVHSSAYTHQLCSCCLLPRAPVPNHFTVAPHRQYPYSDPSLQHYGPRDCGHMGHKCIHDFHSHPAPSAQFEPRSVHRIPSRHYRHDSRRDSFHAIPDDHLSPLSADGHSRHRHQCDAAHGQAGHLRQVVSSDGLAQQFRGPPPPDRVKHDHDCALSSQTLYGRRYISDTQQHDEDSQFMRDTAAHGSLPGQQQAFGHPTNGSATQTFHRAAASCQTPVDWRNEGKRRPHTAGCREHPEAFCSSAEKRHPRLLINTDVPRPSLDNRSHRKEAETRELDLDKPTIARGESQALRLDTSLQPSMCLSVEPVTTPVHDGTSRTGSQAGGTRFSLGLSDIEIIETRVPEEVNLQTLERVKRRLFYLFPNLSQGISISTIRRPNSSRGPAAGSGSMLSSGRRGFGDAHGGATLGSSDDTNDAGASLDVISRYETTTLSPTIYTEQRAGRWIVRGPSKCAPFLIRSRTPEIADVWKIPLDAKKIVERKKLKSTIEMASTRANVKCTECADSGGGGGMTGSITTSVVNTPTSRTPTSRTPSRWKSKDKRVQEEEASLVPTHCHLCQGCGAVEKVFVVVVTIRLATFLPVSLASTHISGRRMPNVDYVDDRTSDAAATLHQRSLDVVQEAAQQVGEQHHRSHSARLLMARVNVERKGVMVVTVDSRGSGKRYFQVVDGGGQVTELKGREAGEAWEPCGGVQMEHQQQQEIRPKLSSLAASLAASATAHNDGCAAMSTSAFPVVATSLRGRVEQMHLQAHDGRDQSRSPIMPQRDRPHTAPQRDQSPMALQRDPQRPPHSSNGGGASTNASATRRYNSSLAIPACSSGPMMTSPRQVMFQLQSGSARATSGLNAGAGTLTTSPRPSTSASIQSGRPWLQMTTSTTTTPTTASRPATSIPRKEDVAPWLVASSTSPPPSASTAPTTSSREQPTVQMRTHHPHSAPVHNEKQRQNRKVKRQEAEMAKNFSETSFHFTGERRKSLSGGARSLFRRKSNGGGGDAAS